MSMRHQSDILVWLKKANGTINKVMQMIEQDVYCADIASQINAAIGLLKSVNHKLLEHHLKCCGPRFLGSQDQVEVDQFVKELIRTRDITKKS